MRQCLLRMLTVTAILFGGSTAGAQETGRIQPYEENPYYWQYKGEPVLLIGGSWQDNLFNHPSNLEEHLDILTDAGGNYVRCTMSSRNEGNVWPFAKNEGGKYDLDQWNEEYWQRLKEFLRMTEQRDIIAQVEIWDPWDFFADHQTQGGWSHNPFNPENNVTYTAEQSGLPTTIDHNPGGEPSDHAFFRTVPALQDNQQVLAYQRAYVDKLLSVAFGHSHVLFCMNNESGERLEWGQYWAEYVQNKANRADKPIEVTDMRRSGDLQGDQHQYFHKRPELYTFIEVSQNNADSGQGHYDDIVGAREMLEATTIRPMNNVKIYTFNGGPDESVERFWRIVFGGCASARFHRPHPLEQPEDHLESHGSGIGLSPRAQSNLKAMRMLTGNIDLFAMRPAGGLLGERTDNEAYCLAEDGSQYAVYFPASGEVELDLSGASGGFELRWLNIPENEWHEGNPVDAGGAVTLETPEGDGAWAALLKPADN